MRNAEGKPDAARLSAARKALAAATAAANASAPSVVESGSAQSAGHRSRGSGRRDHAPDRSAQRDTDGHSEEVARARQIALRQLAAGPRSRQQLTDKMRDRECAPEIIEQVLDRMSEVGLVDDQAYAHMLVRTKREGSGLAVRRLRHELRTRGVPEEMAAAAVAEVEPSQERTQAEALVAARLPRLHGLDRDVQIRRLGGFLARKGYPAGLSFAVIRDAVDQVPEHQRD